MNGADRQTIDVLLDVPLRLTARLGSCTMPVCDVLKLGAGSVVELDRDATAPIDVLANDKLVARGEIVAVGERFGVRITDVPAASA
ncbi:MAG: flagellar motor switch protein FliN [Candidatus Eremiobacteraeota bacterium]|nr:flagellar motor switch protein FliN [Candidatus Eremiobacteraeota bacterium]